MPLHRVTRRIHAVVWFGLLAVVSALAATPRHPNILIFFVDDMGWAQAGCYGGKMAPTPNIDALAQRGVRFSQAYVTSGVCGPSRMSYYTGRYPISHGATWNRVDEQWILALTQLSARMSQASIPKVRLRAGTASQRRKRAGKVMRKLLQRG